MKMLMNKYHKMKNWRKLLGIHGRYKRPFLANAEALLMSNDKSVNIAKMDENLAPSDSESDFGSASESDSVHSNQNDMHEEEDSITSLNPESLAEKSLASPLMKS